MAESTSLAEGCRLGCERFKVEYGKSGILLGRAGYVADTRNLYTHENKCTLACVLPTWKHKSLTIFSEAVISARRINSKIAGKVTFYIYKNF